MVKDRPSQKDIGKAIGISQVEVSRLIECGSLPRSGSLDDYRAANAKRMENIEAGSLDLTGERTRVAKAQADKLEMENAVTRGELVRADDVIERWGAHCTRVTSRLLAMPSKVAPLMMGIRSPAEAQAIIESLVHEALHELSQPG